MERILAALREHFGFSAFRPGQAEAVQAALAGRDLLVGMPPGGGKSLCFQLPALLLDDLALVVSPLVSLMQDQVEALERAVPGRAAVVNAQQDAGVNRAAIARAAAGGRKLLLRVRGGSAESALRGARALLVARLPRGDPRRRHRAVRRRRGALRVAMGS